MQRPPSGIPSGRLSGAPSDRVARLAPAIIDWQEDGTAMSREYGDRYHAAAGAAGQARHVYLGGNGLPQRWQGRTQFVILEAGFGLGHNFLATWAAWRADPLRCERLVYVAFELHPPRLHDMHRAHVPGLGAGDTCGASLEAQLVAHWPTLVPGMHALRFESGTLTLLLILGSAEAALPELELHADAFYLDGFTPALNPAMWSDSLMQHCARLAAPGATCATYTAAHAVRRALERAGFKVQLAQGYAGKQAMTVAHLPRPAASTPAASTPAASTSAASTASSSASRLPEVLVIGAGLAGCATAYALAARGCTVSLIDPLGVAHATSGNSLGALQPRITRDDSIAARFTRAAFLRCVALLRELQRTTPDADLACLQGLLHLARDADEAAVITATAHDLALDPAFAQAVDVQRASALAGVTVAHGGWWFPEGGWVAPRKLCAAMVAAQSARIETRFGTAVHALRARDGGGWQAVDATGDLLGQGDAVVLANADDAVRLCPALEPLQRMRGQLTLWPQSALQAPRVPVTGDGYVMPAHDGRVLVGATYEFDDDPSPALRQSAHEVNAARVTRLLPGTSLHAADSLHGRVGWRAVARDRLPLIGPVHAPAPVTPSLGEPTSHERWQGVHVVAGLASRGITWCVLAGDIVTALICRDPVPLERTLQQAVAPARFAQRRARRSNAIISP